MLKPDLKKAIINMIPGPLKKMYHIFFDARAQLAWTGNYADWSSALKKSLGYDNAVILEKVKASVLKVKNGEAAYERDSVVFDKIEYESQLVKTINQCAKENNGILDVIDFGGSLGSSYFQYKTVLTDAKEIHWNVVEQAHFVYCGKKFIGDNSLKFFDTIEEAMGNRKAHVLYLASVIQYFEEPYDLIEKCLRYNFEYIIIDRTAFIDDSKDRITVQKVPESIYKASYPAWFFSEQKFIGAFTGKYHLLETFVSEVSKPMQLKDNKRVYWKGFILKKKQ